ncbi:hypothetical protein JRYRANMO_CDS_0103 [Salmonella phage FM4b]|uniref:Uncharacterized protein n=1 Tax=Salmonella phage PMBT20 TaxID=3229744 RepID=A0AB39C2W1_9CAUD|nr:hypothetical protein IKARNLZQ_CDS_0101 [Salmonella phage FG1m]WVH07252.1 hypothetical protein JRYRANMO_CDS_0103 [Salmonella phage FM4b]
MVLANFSSPAPNNTSGQYTRKVYQFSYELLRISTECRTISRSSNTTVALGNGH